MLSAGRSRTKDPPAREHASKTKCPLMTTAAVPTWMTRETPPRDSPPWGTEARDRTMLRREVERATELGPPTAPSRAPTARESLLHP